MLGGVCKVRSSPLAGYPGECSVLLNQVVGCEVVLPLSGETEENRPRSRSHSDPSDGGGALQRGRWSLSFLVSGLEGDGREVAERRGARRAADPSVGPVQHGSDRRARGVVSVPGRLTYSRTPRERRPALGKGSSRVSYAWQRRGSDEREPLNSGMAFFRFLVLLDGFAGAGCVRPTVETQSPRAQNGCPMKRCRHPRAARARWGSCEPPPSLPSEESGRPVPSLRSAGTAACEPTDATDQSPT